MCSGRVNKLRRTEWKKSIVTAVCRPNIDSCPWGFFTSLDLVKGFYFTKCRILWSSTAIFFGDLSSLDVVELASESFHFLFSQLLNCWPLLMFSLSLLFVDLFSLFSSFTASSSLSKKLQQPEEDSTFRVNFRSHICLISHGIIRHRPWKVMKLLDTHLFNYFWASGN